MKKSLTLKEKEQASNILEDLKNVKSTFSREERAFINDLEKRRNSWGKPPSVEEFSTLENLAKKGESAIEWSKAAKEFSRERRNTNKHFNKIGDTLKELNLSGEDSISVKYAKNLKVKGKKNLHQYTAEELKKMADEMKKDRLNVNSKNKRNDYIISSALHKDWESFIKGLIPWEELLERLKATEDKLKQLGFSKSQVDQYSKDLFEYYREYTPMGMIFGDKLTIE